MSLSLLLVVTLSFSAEALSAFDPLAIGVGARSLGMGNAYSAIGGDNDSLFSNPAGLGEIDQFNFTSMFGNLMEDLRYTVLGGVYPFGQKSSVGFGYVGTGLTGIDLRDNSGTFSRRANYNNNVGLAAFGKNIAKNLSLGVSLKYYWTEGTEITGGNGNGWNVAVGALQKGPDWLTLALVGQNLLNSSKVNYANGYSETFSPQLKTGARMYIFGSGFNSAFYSPFELSTAVETVFDFKKANSLVVREGIEFSPNRFFTFRAGSDGGILTGGLGLRVAGISFNYAYHPYGDLAENTGHYFSITFDERGWPVEE